MAYIWMIPGNLNYTGLYMLGVVTGWTLSSCRATIMAWLYLILQSIFIASFPILVGSLFTHYLLKSKVTSPIPQGREPCSPLRRISPVPTPLKSSSIAICPINPDSLDISGVPVVSPDIETVTRTFMSKPSKIGVTRQTIGKSPIRHTDTARSKNGSTAGQQSVSTNYDASQAVEKSHQLASCLNSSPTVANKQFSKGKNVLFALNLAPKKSLKAAQPQRLNNIHKTYPINYTLSVPPAPPKKVTTILERAEGEYAFRVKQL